MLQEHIRSQGTSPARQAASAGDLERRGKRAFAGEEHRMTLAA